MPLEYENYLLNYRNETLNFLIKNYNKNLFNKYYVNNPEKYLDEKNKKYSKDLKNDYILYYDFVSARPNLIIKDNKGIHTLMMFKTNKNITNETNNKIALQFTAYYWILLNNGYKVSKTAYLNWIQENKSTKIKIQITDNRLCEWEKALKQYKTNYL